MFVRIYTGDDGQSHFEELDTSEGSAAGVRASGLSPLLRDGVDLNSIVD